MYLERWYAAGAMFEGDDSIWWITGGKTYDVGGTIERYSTEIFEVIEDDFTFGEDLPKTMNHHNLVNVNNTHMVVLGGDEYDNEIFIFDR